MRHKKPTLLYNMTKKTLILPFLSAAFLMSCSKDASYDQLLESDGIDFNIQVAKGLTIPFGSTNKIMLTELMDTAKVKQLYATPDGQFYLSERGDIEPTAFGVAAPKFSFKPTLEGDSFTLETIALPAEVQDVLNALQTAGLLDNYLNKTLGQIPGISGEIQTELTCSDLSFDKGSEFNIHINDVTDGIVEISSVELKDAVSLKLNIKISGLPGVNQRYGLTLDDFTLSLPDFIKVAHLDGTLIDDPTLINMGTVQAVKETGANEATITIGLNILGLDFKDQPVANQNGTIDRPSTASVAGTLTSAAIGIDANDLMLTKDENGTFKVQFASSIAMTPDFEEMNMTLHKVTGKFNPAISSSTSSVDINLGDNMSFLKGDDVTINLKDPAISIDIQNPCPVRVWADFTLKATNGNVVKFDKVDLSDPTGHKNITLNNENTAAGYDFSTFLSPVPDYVEVQIQPYADRDNSYTFTLDDEQEVSGSYNVNIPLEFNSISFTYEKSVDNLWGDSRDDITSKLKTISNAELNLTIENATPMELELEVVGTTFASGVADASLVSCDFSSKVKAGSLSSPSETAMKATLNIHDTEKLGGLTFRIKGDGVNCVFNANQYVRIKSSDIKFNDGIEIDLN